MHRKRRGRKQSAVRVVLADGRVLYDDVSPEFAAGFVRVWNRMAAVGQPRAVVQPRPPKGEPPP